MCDIGLTVVIIIIIGQAVNPTGKINSHKPKGTSMESNSVKKGNQKALNCQVYDIEKCFDSL